MTDLSPQPSPSPGSSPLDRVTSLRVFAPLLLLAALALSRWQAGYAVPGADEGALLTQASRILDGEVYYRDLDAYPFPGGPYLLALVMGIFGEHLGVARGLATGVAVGVVGLVYAMGTRLLAPARAALLGVALLGCKVLAWPSFTGFFYWDLALLGAVLAAAAVVVGRPGAGAADRSGWAFVAGLGVGIAFAAKQSLGIYVGGARIRAIRAASRPRSTRARSRRRTVPRSRRARRS